MEPWAKGDLPCSVLLQVFLWNKGTLWISKYFGLHSWYCMFIISRHQGFWLILNYYIASYKWSCAKNPPRFHFNQRGKVLNEISNDGSRGFSVGNKVHTWKAVANNLYWVDTSESKRPSKFPYIFLSVEAFLRQACLGFVSDIYQLYAFKHIFKNSVSQP